MGRVVIACYRPKPGQQEALRTLVRSPVPVTTQQSDFFFVMEQEWGAGPGAPGKLLSVLRSLAAHKTPVRLEAGRATIRFGGAEDPIAVDSSEVYRVYHPEVAGAP